MENIEERRSSRRSHNNDENASIPHELILDPDNMELCRLNAALGSVFGAFIGDALGSAIEFKKVITPEMLTRTLAMEGGIFGNGPGQVTDDSELAMCLLHGLHDSLPNYSANSIATHYRTWIESNPFDIGNTTRAALGQLYHKSGERLAEYALGAARTYNQGSKSNGSFMRASPLAVWGRRLPVDDLVQLVHEEAGFTHSNETVKQAESYYIICMAHLIQNPQDKAGALRAADNYLRGCNEEVKEWVNDSLGELPMPGTPNMGYVKIAFDHTFRQLRKDDIDYDRAIEEVLSIGGDTDTNACIAGAMIGAYVGYDRLNQMWKYKVENFDARKYGGIDRKVECLNQTLVKGLVEGIFRGAPSEFRRV